MIPFLPGDRVKDALGHQGSVEDQVGFRVKVRWPGHPSLARWVNDTELTRIEAEADQCPRCKGKGMIESERFGSSRDDGDVSLGYYEVACPECGGDGL